VWLSLFAPGLAAQVRPSTIPQQPAVPAWQKAAGGRMSFEVATVRLAKPGPFLSPSFSLGVEDAAIPPGGRFFASFALEDFIEFAYKIMPTPEQQEAMLAELPKWAKSNYFVIQAEAPGNPTKDQMRLMMQALLADRFDLRVHFETRSEPVLALVLIREGRPGPRIRPHSEGPDCGTQWTPPLDRTAPTVPPGEFIPECGTFDGVDGPDNTFLAGARNATLAQLADYLAWEQDFGRPVVDQTGLSGRFDFTLQWTPEYKKPHDDGTRLDVSGPSLIEALKEQFGMKLKSTRAPVQVLLIDHVDPPSPN
jgi:uncharacterized protein (TIGR03435 family)